jgi:uncharacterized repeat protein (TIGR01451 family)
MSLYASGSGDRAAESAANDNATGSAANNYARKLRRYLRKIVLPAVSIAALSTLSADAQQRNPFAEWDRLEKKTNATLEQAGSRTRAPAAPATGGIDYFAAGGATATLPPTLSSPAPVVRERMATSPAELPKPPVPAISRPSAPIIPAVGAAARAARNQASWPASFEVHSKAVNPFIESPPQQAGAEKPARRTSVTSANFVQGPDAAEPVIQQTAGSTPGAAAAEQESSLNHFLEQYGTPPSPQDNSLIPTLPNLTMPPEPAREAAQPQKPLPADADRRIAVDIDSRANGPQSPGVTLKWVHDGDLNVGQECPVELVVHNTSASAIRGVYVEAVIPANLQVLASDPKPESGSAVPSWTFGELQPDEKRTVKLKTIPRQRGDIRLNAFVRLTGYSSSEFIVQEPMIKVALSGPAAGALGQQLNYDIKVTNPGTGVARNVIVQAALPEGLEHRNGSLITMEVGTLTPGESQQVHLSLNAVRGGDQSLAVRVLADGDLTDHSETTVAVAEPQLDLLIDGPTDTLTGRSSDFELVVVNRGKVASSNVRARYRVPEGFEFVSADRGGKFSSDDRTVEFFVGTLQPGANSNFLLTLKAADTGSQLHQAGVISEHGQVTMARRQTVVEGTAELKLDVAATKENIRAGEETVFEITIQNTGDRAATNVGLSCEMPAGLELMGADGPSEYIAENGVIVFRSMPGIEAGDSVAVTLRAKAKRDGAHSLRLRVASGSISEPLIGEKTCNVAR